MHEIQFSTSGTSLLAGLLGGDENFGKVLGDYVGLSVEGLSGGGGAVSFQVLTFLFIHDFVFKENNGEFFGNFIGTLFGYLSAVSGEDYAKLFSEV